MSGNIKVPHYLMIKEPVSIRTCYRRIACFPIIFLLSFLFLNSPNASEDIGIKVSKTSGCGCCVAWIDHLKDNGFSVKSENLAMGRLIELKQRNGIKPELASCHTAKVQGYTIEGHVPAREIQRLMSERPEAIGLTVPAMPLGSPGMDQGPEREGFDVLLIQQDGSTQIYATYPGSK